MKTMSMKFFLKPLKSNKDKHSVCLQVLYNRTKAEMSTGLRCKLADWDDSKERFKKSTTLNQKLSEIQENTYRAKNELDDKGRYYTAKDIKLFLKGDTRLTIRLIDFYSKYLESKRESLATISTVKKYEQTFEYLNGYLTENSLINITLSKIDKLFINQFDEYLKGKSWNSYGEKLGLTTINKHHSRFKAVINSAIGSSLLNTNPYSSFKLSFPPSNREYLTVEELKKLTELDLSSNNSLDITRDIFIFSCFTGLRYGDAINLSMDNIEVVGGKPYLKIDQEKTGLRREIPLLDNASEIVNKYENCKDRVVLNRVLPTLSNQKINQYLKIIAELTGIKKPLSHHIARHTCATTILLDNQVPLETVSHWLGHNSVRTTQIYAKISHSNLEKERERLNEIIV